MTASSDVTNPGMANSNVTSSDVQKIFSIFSNRNGVIPEELVAKGLMCAGFVVQGSSIDCGSLDFEGFKSMVENARKIAIPRERIEAAFRAFDKQETGYISARELQNILSFGTNPLSQLNIQEFMGYAVPDDRGMICYKLLIDSLYAE